jgi:DNA-directed RNA polymerase subunit beta'
LKCIVSQMMQKVEILDPGDTTFLPGEYVDKLSFREDNDLILDKKVVLESGDSEKLKPGQIITARELRDENSVAQKTMQEACRSTRCISCSFKTNASGYYPGIVEN